MSALAFMVLSTAPSTGTRSMGKSKHGPPALNLLASGDSDGCIITRYSGVSQSHLPVPAFLALLPDQLFSHVPGLHSVRTWSCCLCS